MHRFSVLGGIIVSLLLFVACSGSSSLSEKDSASSQPQAPSEYPAWFNSSSFVNTDAQLLGYTTAIGADSAKAVSKAASRATTELKAALSDKLETIRSEALTQFGSGYGLDSSRFLIALRKADNAVNSLATKQNAEAKKVKGQSSYRGFVEVGIDKGQLIERIGKRLGGYEKAWGAMKKSNAFKDF